jgi:hypothetical protein
VKRGAVVDMHAWLWRKVQAEQRERDGDGIERLRANHALSALSRLRRKLDGGKATA